MAKIFYLIIALIVLFVSIPVIQCKQENKKMKSDNINLPKPKFESKTSVEQALLKRRSHRDFSDSPLNLDEVSQLLWAAQGITDTSDMLRTAPSAGALYPLEIYLIAGKVNGLQTGIYQYIPTSHSLSIIRIGEHREDLCSAAMNQPSASKAPVSILITAIWDRVTAKYGERGKQYTIQESGHVAQNIMLQCVSLNLSSVPVGAFYDDQMKTLVKLQNGEDPLYVLPVGKRRD